jgi:hypothetical protein
MTSAAGTVRQPRPSGKRSQIDETPILFASEFLIQQQPDEFFVNIGQATRLAPAPVYTIVRVALTRHRLIELISLLEHRLAPAPAPAPASAFPQLIAARERQLAWTREFAAASDITSALETFLDVDAISAELLE